MSKKDMEKAENKQISVKKLYKTATILLFVAVLAGGGYYVWDNFDAVKAKIAEYKTAEKESETPALTTPDWFSLVEEKADKASVSALQEKIMNLQTIVNELALRQSSATEIANLNSRVDNMQDLLIASVNGKADASAVLGLISRLDRFENELERVSHFNNDGALMLAATTLVKENALDGKDFSFEAAVLSEIAGDNSKIADQLQIVEDAAQVGISGNVELAYEFARIYDKLNSKDEEKEIEQSWTDRLNSKLNELITINKTDEQKAGDKQKEFMQALKDLASERKFAQIAALVQNSGNEYLNSNQDLQMWIAKVQNKQNFEAAINKISAYCLMLMKIDSLYGKER